MEVLSRFRRAHGGAVAGVPGSWRADRLAVTLQPHRLDLLWAGTDLRDAALHYGVRRPRPARDFRLALGRVCGLVLDVDRVLQPHPRSILDVVVSQRSATVSA